MSPCQNGGSWKGEFSYYVPMKKIKNKILISGWTILLGSPSDKLLRLNNLLMKASMWKAEYKTQLLY